MAKSLRSKWRRKMRNIKRERYGKKELIRLKKMLGLPVDEEEVAAAAANADVVMTFEPKEKSENVETENVMSAKDMRRIHSLVREGSDREDSDVEKEIEDVIVMTTSRKLRMKNRERRRKEDELKNEESSEKIDEPVEEMEHDQKRVYNKKTWRDQYGNYPVWMNQKKVQKLSKNNKRAKKKEMKRLRKRPYLKKGKGRPSGNDNSNMDTEITAA